jgi:ribosomal protein S18 acetylase RimI-like enzyme
MNKIQKKVIASKAIKFEVKDGKKIIGRVFLYVIKNDLHKQAYGYIEDLFVDESLRGQGYGKKLLQMVILEAKKRKLYKLVGTSRESRKQVHSFYEKFGFKKYGIEFRINF